MIEDNMKSRPMFSICIAVYNLEKYIAECLESTLDQQYDDYEIVVVDNGSTDRSIQICREYQERYPKKIRFFALPQPTVIVRAHIYAVEQAQGKYIHLIDGDDCVAKNYLLRMHQIVTEKSSDMILGTFECIVEKGASNYMDVPLDASQINNVPYEAALVYLLTRPYFNRYVWRFVVKRELFDLVRFPEDIAHLTYVDTLKTTMWLFCGESIYFESEPIYYYRRRKAGTTGTRGGRTAVDALKTALAIAYLVTDVITEKRKQIFYQYNQIHIWQHIQIFLAEVDYIHYEEWEELQQFICRHQEWLRCWTNFSQQKLVEWTGILKNGSIYKQVCEIDQAWEKQILQRMTEGQEIYLFPYGSYAEKRKRQLKRMHLSVAGYLDNDIKKDGLDIDGIRCQLPYKLPEEKYQNSLFVICTFYPQVQQEIWEQLQSFGVDSDNIVIDI
ncbi:MAG: glycosyltransferase family 2 protein [Lachnospiraceae bacterium]|nr:glycosyltransferase family 2 protein [Lachnospiraceae bacterium]